MYSAKTGLQNIENKRKNYETLLTKFEATKADIAAKELEQSINQGAASLLGRSGFLGSIFDEILTDIEVRTNDMLSHFPNASQFTVGISSTREIKSKGTTKKEISIGISRNGMELSLDDNASGGQQSGIELCSDLGAAEAIIARSGGSLKWICLDEVLDGLGAEEKRAVVAMIKERFKGLVFMIEHSTEIRESFDKIIEVEYDGRESHVISV
jgi:DNA repair exonuclease SbcCD ATPase subunit